MSNELAVQTQPKASDQLASFLGIEKSMMIETIKAQCFKGKHPDEVSDTQLAAFISTANILQVNPLVPGMIYCYPSKNGGIEPILGPDGVFKKLDEFISTGKLSGYECEVDCEATGKPIKATATIYRKGDEKPAKYTAWFSEWCVGNNPNWQSRPRHMLWTRAIKQCARQVIHGLPMDADEYAIAQMTNVTESAEEKPEVKRADPPARRGSVKAATKTEEAATPAEPVVEQPAASKKADAKFTGPTVDAEIVEEKTEAQIDHEHQQALKAQRQAESAAKAKTAAKAEAAKPAPLDLSKVPDVAEGVSIAGIHGKAWPQLCTATINNVKSVEGATPHHKLTVTSHSPAEATFEIVVFRKVTVNADKVATIEPTPDFIATGKVIEFNAVAKLRQLPTKNAAGPIPANIGPDGKALPDLTKPPAIIASNVTEATVPESF